VIAEIRSIDPDNLIIVGTPNWSQDVDDAAANPITAYNNIAYTLHFYAGTHTDYLRNKAQAALDSGIPLFVTEWGAVDASGDGGVDAEETNRWVEFMKANKLSHLNWAINDKEEGSSIVTTTASSTGSWTEDDLTVAGVLVKDIILDFNGVDGNVSEDPANPTDPIDAVYTSVDPVTVQGNRVLYGSSDTPIAGNSFFWSNEGWGAERFHNADLISWLKEDWGSQIVRVAMGVEETGGYLEYSDENIERVRAVVNAAIANDMYVLIDWHTHHAEDYEAEAIAFFKQMATEFGEYNHVIYEVYNEPLAVSWDNVIKPYAERVIAEIRAIDPDNLIIVGTPNWSQDVDDAAANPITAYDNIAYTLHFYAGTHTDFLRSKAQTALDSGIPLFVTEWGAVNASGDGGVDATETNRWVEFMKENKLSHLNWAINDKEEGSSIVTSDASSTGSWADDVLTEAGVLVKNIILDFNGVDVDSNTVRLTAKNVEGTAVAGVASTVISNVTDGDEINGSAVQLGVNVTVLEIGEWPTGIMLGSDTGAVTTSENVEAGIFEMHYRLCDISNTENCEEALVKVVVEEEIVNQAPDAESSVRIINSDNAETTLTVPGVGVWSVDTSSGDITFVPESGFEGSASIDYTVWDTGGLESDLASVFIEYAEKEDNGLTEIEQEDLNNLLIRAGSFGSVFIPLLMLFGLRRLMPRLRSFN